jgi:uncharacterized membrane protein YfhO
MNDLSSNPDLPMKAARPGALSEAQIDRNSLTVVTEAAARLHHAMGDPVPKGVLGFFAELWAVVVSFVQSVWRSITTSWQPANYLALVFIFLAGVMLSDLAMRYVRVFSSIIVILIGIIVTTMLVKNSNSRQQ